MSTDEAPEEELGSNLLPDPPVVLKAKRGPKSKDDWYKERQWVVVEENADIPPTGLSLSVNGDVVMLMPGEPVHLQNKFLEVLDHAIVSVPQMDNTNRVVGSRQRHRFPYRKVDAPTNAA